MNGYCVRIDGQGSRSVDDESWCMPEEKFRPISEGPPPDPVTQDPPATPSDIDRERDRRVDDGFTHDGVYFQSRPNDRENIADAASLALKAIADGSKEGDLRWQSPDKDFVWISSDNLLIPMDAFDVVKLGKVSAERKQALIFAGRKLKDMNAIPADYKKDKWWK